MIPGILDSFPQKSSLSTRRFTRFSTALRAKPTSYCSPTLHMSNSFLLWNTKSCLDRYRYVPMNTGANGHIMNFLSMTILAMQATSPAAPASAAALVCTS